MEKIYELKTPFTYASKGEQVDAGFITLLEPAYKTMAHFVPIKQAFTSAIQELAESGLGAKNEQSTDSEKDGDIDGSQVIGIMYGWSGEMSSVFLHAEQLFKSGAALVDGERVLTSEMIGKMAWSDIEAMLGEYIANFIVPSLMGGR